MNGSLGHFKAILQRRKERQQKSEGKFEKQKPSYSSEQPPAYNFPKLSEQELEKVKQDIRLKIKAENKKQLLILVAVAILLLSVLFYLL